MRLSKNLRKLNDFLISEAVDDDAMLLGELDGFLAGVIICPDLIQPGEWLPLIWGEEEPLFEDEQQANTIVNLIMGRYNSIIRELDRGAYKPLYQIDTDGSVLWEFWIEGFWRAMSLRPDGWLAFGGDDDTPRQQALFLLGRLTELVLRPDEFEPLDIDADLEDAATDIIPLQVEVLHRARLAIANPIAAAANQNQQKVGRNDPCPCGSGKKYKKCCLAEGPLH